MRWLHRQGADYDLFVLNNPSREGTVRSSFSFRPKGTMEIWDARTGKRETSSAGEIEIEPAGSRLVMIRRDRPPVAHIPYPKRQTGWHRL
jgi:hypothetical protein